MLEDATIRPRFHPLTEQCKRIDSEGDMRKWKNQEWRKQGEQSP